MDKIPQPTLRSRRHLLRAAGIVAGAAATLVPVTASADTCLLGIICFGDGTGGSGGSGGTGGTGGGTTTGGGTSGGTPCFLRGTRVRTAKGYRPVEALAVGDEMPTHFGSRSAIRRIDSYTVERDIAGQWPQDGRMVRIRRSAFADGVPSSDLCMTANHAVFLDGVLVRIGSLINGITILFDDAEDRETLEFFHFHFDTHDVIEAEGAACESLQAEGMKACAPILEFTGGRSELGSRLRSAAAPILDRRTRLDILRDRVEERSLSL